MEQGPSSQDWDTHGSLFSHVYCSDYNFSNQPLISLGTTTTAATTRPYNRFWNNIILGHLGLVLYMYYTSKNDGMFYSHSLTFLVCKSFETFRMVHLGWMLLLGLPPLSRLCFCVNSLQNSSRPCTSHGSVGECSRYMDGLYWFCTASCDGWNHSGDTSYHNTLCTFTSFQSLSCITWVC